MKDRKIKEGIVCFAALLLTAVVFFLLGANYTVLFGNTLHGQTELVITSPPESEPEKDTSAAAAPDASVSNPDNTPAGKIRLNSATVEELMQVPGIGEVFARRIVAYRELIGRYTAMDQLMEVEGIGQGRYNSWSPYFILD